MIKLFYILLAFIILTSCIPLTEKNSESALDISTEDTYLHERNKLAIEDKAAFDKDSSNIDTASYRVDSSIVLKHHSDTAFLFKGEQLIERTFIQPKVVLNEDSSQQVEVHDEVFLVANNMIVVREVITMGHFCHVPEVSYVEIHSVLGDTSYIISDTLPSESLLGFDLVNNFLGNRFSSPDGTWGVITIEAEGQVYGLMIIHNDGSYQEINLSEEYSLSGEIYKAEFSASNQLVWLKMYDDDKPVRLEVNKKGEIKIYNL